MCSFIFVYLKKVLWKLCVHCKLFFFHRLRTGSVSVDSREPCMRTQSRWISLSTLLIQDYRKHRRSGLCTLATCNTAAFSWTSDNLDQPERHLISSSGVVTPQGRRWSACGQFWSSAGLPPEGKRLVLMLETYRDVICQTCHNLYFYMRRLMSYCFLHCTVSVYLSCFPCHWDQSLNHLRIDKLITYRMKSSHSLNREDYRQTADVLWPFPSLQR